MNNNNNLTKYLNWLQERNYSLTSIITYQKAIKKYGRGLIFTKEGLKDLVKQWVNKIEPATCRTYLAALASYAKFKEVKVDWEKIHKIIPAKLSKFYNTINEHELKLLKLVKFEKSEAFYQRNNLILDFLFYSGIRISELIKIKHRDWQNNQLRILGKGNKARSVFLPPFLVKYFQTNSRDYLFATHVGNKIHPENIRQMIHRKTQLSQLNKLVTPHTFRRSFATNSYNRQVRLETIQKQLGHDDINTTMAYIHNDYETLYADYSKLWKTETNLNVHDYQR